MNEELLILLFLLGGSIFGYSVVGFIYFSSYVKQRFNKDDIPFHVRLLGGPIVWWIRFRIWLYNKRRGLN